MTGPRAVFLDRDGVLDELVYYADTNEWEAPRTPGALRMRPGVAEPLRRATEAGWLLFIITNQPSFAKGKCRLEDLQAVQACVLDELARAGVTITDAFACYHHPEAVVEGYGACKCRKPAPFFLRAAAENYHLDLARSWIIGDQDSDVETGRRAGCRTALLEYEPSAAKRGASAPDLVGRDLADVIGRLI